jgi:hypothetical protein
MSSVPNIYRTYERTKAKHLRNCAVTHSRYTAVPYYRISVFPQSLSSAIASFRFSVIP